MLTVKNIRERKKEIGLRLRKRGLSDDIYAVLEEVIQLDDQRKENQSELDQLLSEINALSSQIGALYKKGDTELAEGAKAKVGHIKEQSKQLEQQQKKILASLEELLVTIPNVPHPSVPAGKSESDNEIEFKSAFRFTLE